MILFENASKSIAKLVSKVIAKIVKVSATVNGPTKGSVKIVCHYKYTNTTYGATIGLNGNAIITVKISRATKKYTVAINLSLTYKGKVDATKNSFIPRQAILYI
ncbi:hypothetical protein K2F40_15100 [Clostridium sp. CM028]|uniref:hypothetical protein n=1 Tax=Clostridium sp. CM028 TaxID=2851575 RepID=UPI001C6E95B9|nr:hypothetical protein [Clostridium sp. CM028]MBW9150286.1 hypothetical protein [Clostridium sp. CM028]WLC62838.1 hypothetical protein KTC94_06175 [Clostridium sp. CM028]